MLLLLESWDNSSSVSDRLISPAFFAADSFVCTMPSVDWSIHEYKFWFFVDVLGIHGGVCYRPLRA